MDNFHTKDLSQSSFLITGGAGFIGSHIAEYLLKNGAGKVRVLDNLVNGFQSNLDILKQYNQFEFIEGDIRNIDTCQQACTGMDYVSHQAALGSVPRSIKEPVYFTEVNIGGFANMLKAAIDNNIKLFMVMSQPYPNRKTRLAIVYHLMPLLKRQMNYMPRFLQMCMVSN